MNYHLQQTYAADSGSYWSSMDNALREVTLRHPQFLSFTMESIDDATYFIHIQMVHENHYYHLTRENDENCLGS